MNFPGAARHAVPVLAAEGEAGVLNQENVETQVGCHAHGGFHRVVGDDTRDGQRYVSCRTQARFQIGPNESAVGALGDDGFAIQGLSRWLKLVSLLTGAI